MEVIVAFRTNLEVAFQTLVIDERVAGGALGPADFLICPGLGCHVLHIDPFLYYRDSASVCSRRCSSSSAVRAASTSSRVGAGRSLPPNTWTTAKARTSVVRPKR